MEHITSLVSLPRSKRIFDILCSLFLLLLSLPFVCLVVFWFLLESIFISSSRGTLFYKETRISQGKPFLFYKFRIFKQSAIQSALDQTGFIHTKRLESNLNNLTYLGKFLKRIYMDELPQLWNVLKGDMTLVGPRPTNTVNSENFKKIGNFTKERMRCGITGPYQAQKDKGLDKRKVDEEYIDFVATHSGREVVVKDLGILLKTIRLIFKAQGL